MALAQIAMELLALTTKHLTNETITDYQFTFMKKHFRIHTSSNQNKDLVSFDFKIKFLGVIGALINKHWERYAAR